MSYHRDMYRALKEAGFWLKSNNKHEVWTDGRENITLPRGSKMSPAMFRGVMSRIRKRASGRNFNVVNQRDKIGQEL